MRALRSLGDEKSSANALVSERYERATCQPHWPSEPMRRVSRLPVKSTSNISIALEARRQKYFETTLRGEGRLKRYDDIKIKCLFKITFVISHPLSNNVCS